MGWVTGKLGVSAQTIGSLEKAGAIRVAVSRTFRNPVKLEKSEEHRNTLSESQQRIVRRSWGTLTAGSRVHTCSTGSPAAVRQRSICS